MKKLILIIIIFVFCNSCIEKPITKWEWIFNYISSYKNITKELNDFVIIELTDLIMNNTDKYNLPYQIVTRLCAKESKFKQYAYNRNSHARSYGQILDKHWRYALYHIRNGEIGRKLNKHNITNIQKLKYYYYDRTNAIELMCFALNACRKHKDYSLYTAIYMYGGGFSKGACKKHMQEYMDFILFNKK